MTAEPFRSRHCTIDGEMVIALTTTTKLILEVRRAKTRHRDPDALPSGGLSRRRRMSALPG